MGLCISRNNNAATDIVTSPPSSQAPAPASSRRQHRSHQTQPPEGMPARLGVSQPNASGIKRARALQPLPARAGSASARAAAAELARQATDPEHPKFMDLSAAMCWDAVKLCAVEVHAVDRNVDAQHGLVSHADALVVDRNAIASVPAGHVLGFFEGPRLVHAMLAVGGGRACGNKNDCVGIGHAVGWEELDLGALRWAGNGGITAPGLLSAERTLQVRARPLGGQSA